VDTKVKTLLIAAALLGAVGCSGNDGSGQVATYVYPTGNPVTVPASFCVLVNGQFDLTGNGSMNYAIDDLSGTDTIEAVVISDSFYSTESAKPCGFTTAETIVDVSFVGSRSDKIGFVADVYDFVVTCANSDDAACAFNLTWTATY
jgi:hypothetical protein